MTTLGTTIPEPRDVREAALAVLPFRSAGPRPGFVGGTLGSIRDILAQRELLGLLVRREIKARYKDSILGFLWSLLRPLAMLLVYWIVLGNILGAARGTPDFAVFIFAGLTAWGLFTDIVLGGTGSIVNNAGLIKKVYLPREVFPLSVVGSALFNFAMQLVILLAFTALSGSFPAGIRWVYFLLALVLVLVWGTALALFLAAANVHLRDVQYLVEIATMIFMWASPIVYPWALAQGQLARAPGWVEHLYLANPMTIAVIGFQRAFWVSGDGMPQPGGVGVRLVVMIAVSVVLLWLAQRVFARLQANFAQEL